MTSTLTGVIPTWTSGDFLRKARESANLTQAELAAKLGLDARTVRDSERGLRPMRAERVLAWAMATGVDHVWLSEGVAR